MREFFEELSFSNSVHEFSNFLSKQDEVFTKGGVFCIRPEHTRKSINIISPERGDQDAGAQESAT
jgi:hypothetical protein